VTEIGRRIGILAGAASFAICILVGVISNSDLLMTTVYAIIGGLGFGMGGYIIGTMIDGYVAKAFRRQLAKRIIEKDLEEASRLAAKQANEQYEDEIEEEVETAQA